MLALSSTPTAPGPSTKIMLPKSHLITVLKTVNKSYSLLHWGVKVKNSVYKSASSGNRWKEHPPSKDVRSILLVEGLNEFAWIHADSNMDLEVEFPLPR